MIRKLHQFIEALNKDEASALRREQRDSAVAQFLAHMEAVVSGAYATQASRLKLQRRRWSALLAQTELCLQLESMVLEHPQLKLLPPCVRPLRYADYLHACQLVEAHERARDEQAEAEQARRRAAAEQAACARLHARL